MSLADALAQARKSGNAYYTRGCAVGRYLRTLSDDERRVVAEYLALPTSDLGHRAFVAAVLAESGVRLTDQGVGRHRAGKCRCEPV